MGMGRIPMKPINTKNMSEYECIYPIDNFRLGDQISKDTYFRIDVNKRPHFKPMSRSESVRQPDIIDTGIDLLAQSVIISAGMDLFGSSDSSGDSGSSFDGFGGGDFGGGGSSGDF